MQAFDNNKKRALLKIDRRISTGRRIRETRLTLSVDKKNQDKQSDGERYCWLLDCKYKLSLMTGQISSSGLCGSFIPRRIMPQKNNTPVYLPEGIKLLRLSDVL